MVTLLIPPRAEARRMANSPSSPKSKTCHPAKPSARSAPRGDKETTMTTRYSARAHALRQWNTDPRSGCRSQVGGHGWSPRPSRSDGAKAGCRRVGAFRSVPILRELSTEPRYLLQDIYRALTIGDRFGWHSSLLCERLPVPFMRAARYRLCVAI